MSKWERLLGGGLCFAVLAIAAALCGLTVLSYVMLGPMAMLVFAALVGAGAEE